MKALITFGGGFIVAVFVLSSFSSSPLTEREKQICHNCEKDNFKEVPLQDFAKDVARYNGTHVKEVKPGLRSATGKKDIEPSRVCMYTLDTLKKFICFIETYAKAARLKGDSLGINFYYAVYPKEKAFNGQDFGSLHTLYMVPTYYHPGYKRHIPIDVKALAKYVQENPNNEKFSILDFSLGVLLKRSPNHPTFMMSLASFSSPTLDAYGNTIINQGQLCPPACGGTEWNFGAATY